MRKQILNLVAGAGLLAVMVGMFSIAQTANAQIGSATSFSIESVGTQVGLGDADLRTTIVNIIRWVLGFMTLLAVVFIIYGGFTWLTAGGNEENVEKAKRIITAAVIGLIIILLGWAIVIFVARTTANVTR